MLLLSTSHFMKKRLKIFIGAIARIRQATSESSKSLPLVITAVYV